MVYKIAQESLLASEVLSMQRSKAEGETPQFFEAFTKASEEKAIEERQERNEQDDSFDSGSPSDSSSDSGGEPSESSNDGDESVDGSGESPDSDKSESKDEDGEKSESSDESTDPAEEEQATKDSIDDSKETTEGFGDWVKEKTEFSDSATVRNIGALISGLSHLGITYGPALMGYMFKGVLWAFSRLGALIFEGGQGLANYIEKTRNSVDKLEARLKTAEDAITASLNEGGTVPSFTYRNKAAIGYLKIGEETDFPANIRRFSDSLTKTTASLSSEFEAGIELVQRMAKMDSKAKASGIDKFMQVSAPRQGFSKGTVAGFEAKSDDITQYRSEYWPGDVSLIFDCPDVKSADIKEITEAYEKAGMYLAVNKAGIKPIEQVQSLDGAQLVILAKATHILLAACRQVSKTHEKMKDMHPTAAQAAKRMFFDLADDKTRTRMADTMLEPVFLRCSLATKVYVSGSTAALTHASRVAASAVKVLEDHAQKLVSQSE